jgi:iron complex outermembrane receptor protein
VRGEVSAFANRIDDYLLLMPQRDVVTTVRGVFPLFAHQQTDARLVGVDGGAEVDAGRFTLGTAFALLRGDDLGRDQPLFQMPADRVRLTLGYALPNLSPLGVRLHEPGVSLEMTQAWHQDRYPTTTDATGAIVPLGYAAPPPGYTVWSARVHTQIRLGRGRPARLSLTADNLLDTAYRDALSRYRLFAHDAGRNLVLRLDLPFGRGDHHD